MLLVPNNLKSKADVITKQLDPTQQQCKCCGHFMKEDWIYCQEYHIEGVCPDCHDMLGISFIQRFLEENEGKPLVYFIDE